MTDMTRPIVLAAALMFAMPVAAEDAASPYDDPGAEWVLTALDGTDFEARATLVFAETGRVAGQAPCNRYTGAMIADFPAFATGPLAVTRMACPEGATETAFFQALEAMEHAEMRADVLVLLGPEGQEMVFTRAE